MRELIIEAVSVLLVLLALVVIAYPVVMICATRHEHDPM